MLPADADQRVEDRAGRLDDPRIRLVQLLELEHVDGFLVHVHARDRLLCRVDLVGDAVLRRRRDAGGLGIAADVVDQLGVGIVEARRAIDDLGGLQLGQRQRVTVVRHGAGVVRQRELVAVLRHAVEAERQAVEGELGGGAVDHGAGRGHDRAGGIGKDVRAGGAVVRGSNRAACQQREALRHALELGGARARVLRARVGAGRRGGGDLRRVGDQRAEAGRRVAGRLDLERVVGVHRHVDADGEAIDIHVQRERRRGARLRGHHGVVRHARQRVVGAVVLQRVVAGGQVAGVVGGGVADVDRGDGGRRIVVVGVDHGRAQREHVRADGAIQVDTQLVLVIEGLADGQRQAADGVLRRVQRLAAELQHAADGTARHRAVLGFDHVAVGQREAEDRAARIGGRGNRLHVIRIRTHHQRLAVADEDVVGTTVLHHHLGAHQFGQLGDGLVALVEQVVGRLAAGRGGHAGDFLVQVGDLLGVVVDLRHRRLDLRVQAILKLLEVVARRLHLAGQRLRGGQHALARRRIGRRVRHSLHGREELLHQRRQAALLVGQQVVDLRNLVRVGRQLRAGGRGAAQLAGQEAVVDALDGDRVGALAVEARAGVLAARRRDDRVLARVTRGGRVAEVVADRRERVLRSVQARKTDIKERHVSDPGSIG